MLFARQTVFLILAVVSCSASDEKINAWQRRIPYIETTNGEEAVFIVHFFATHKGREIRKSNRFFKEKADDLVEKGYFKFIKEDLRKITSPFVSFFCIIDIINCYCYPASCLRENIFLAIRFEPEDIAFLLNLPRIVFII